MKNEIELQLIIKLGCSPIAEIFICNGRLSVYSYILSRHLDYYEKREFIKEIWGDIWKR